MADYGLREDGTPKGLGYFGELKRPDNNVSTELSFDFDHPDYGNVFAPLLVPTLTKDEIDHLLSDKKPTPEIYQKAQDFAVQRLKAKQPTFAMPNEIYPVPQPPIQGVLSPLPIPRGVLAK